MGTLIMNMLQLYLVGSTCISIGVYVLFGFGPALIIYGSLLCIVASIIGGAKWFQLYLAVLIAIHAIWLIFYSFLIDITRL